MAVISALLAIIPPLELFSAVLTVKVTDVLTPPPVSVTVFTREGLTEYATFPVLLTSTN
jgi:hypothetical protein